MMILIVRSYGDFNYDNTLDVRSVTVVNSILSSTSLNYVNFWL